MLEPREVTRSSELVPEFPLVPPNCTNIQTDTIKGRVVPAAPTYSSEDKTLEPPLHARDNSFIALLVSVSFLSTTFFAVAIACTFAVRTHYLCPPGVHPSSDSAAVSWSNDSSKTRSVLR